MAFVKKTWVDRIAQYAGRRTLTNVATLESATYDVIRSEGDISAEGDAFNASNMNGLETRIYDSLNLMNKVFNNVSVPASAWATYTASLTNEGQILSEYAYKADITLSGVTANHACMVSFSPAQIKDGVFAPYFNSQSGKLRIYANAKPAGAITIPTITAIAKGV